MTDEEMSELAECLAEAARDKLLMPFACRYGYDSILPGHLPCCALGALLGATAGDDCSVRYPNPGVAATELGLPGSIAWGLAHGFDGAPIALYDDARAFDLGRLFREEYCR